MYEIPKEEVDFYNSEKRRLPCWECLVKSTCFKEKKHRESDDLGYTVELGNPCIDAILTMDLIEHADELEIPLWFLDEKDTETLFDDALYSCDVDPPSSCGGNYIEVGYAMFIRIVQRDPNYVYNGYDTAYYNLGNIFISEFGDFDNAIELYSRAIDLVSNRADAFEKRGRCWLEKKGKKYLKNALADFKKAIAIDESLYPDLKSTIHDIEKRIDS
jgi:tetratricopeptide (TPR) repeat protein